MSEVDIVNLSLSHIGQDANVSSLTEGSIEAERAAQFYPIALRAMLEMHPWGFATKLNTNPALLEHDRTDWIYAYDIPADAVTVFAVLPPGVSPSDLQIGLTVSFARQSLGDGEAIFTNQENAALLYGRSVTNTALFTAGFKLALSRLLASYLAGPLIKGDVGRKEAAGQLQFFQVEAQKAMAMDARQTVQEKAHRVPWMEARR